MLMMMALLVALLLEGAVQELRMARGDVAAARAQATAGTALSDLFATRPDSAMLASPRGVTALSSVAVGADTTWVALESLGGGLVRVVASARSWSGGARADAANLGFARIVADSAAPPGTLRFQRLPGWWWAPVP